MHLDQPAVADDGQREDQDGDSDGDVGLAGIEFMFGLVYVLLGGYFAYRAIHDGTFSADGLVGGYTASIVSLIALNRKAKRAEVESRI
jgi:hypothetical protein